MYWRGWLKPSNTRGAGIHSAGDNGPEFIAQVNPAWLKEKQIKTIYIEPVVRAERVCREF